MLYVYSTLFPLLSLNADVKGEVSCERVKYMYIRLVAGDTEAVWPSFPF
jgi:hypothetical protein